MIYGYELVKFFSDEEGNKNDFSKTKTRVGIGWINDRNRNSKVDSERYLRAANDAADKKKDSGASDEDVVKAAKRAATNTALLDSVPKPLLKSGELV